MAKGRRMWKAVGEGGRRKEQLKVKTCLVWVITWMSVTLQGSTHPGTSLSH